MNSTTFYKPSLCRSVCLSAVFELHDVAYAHLWFVIDYVLVMVNRPVPEVRLVAPALWVWHAQAGSQWNDSPWKIRSLITYCTSSSLTTWFAPLFLCSINVDNNLPLIQAWNNMLCLQGCCCLASQIQGTSDVCRWFTPSCLHCPNSSINMDIQTILELDSFCYVYTKCIYVFLMEQSLFMNHP